MTLPAAPPEPPVPPNAKCERFLPLIPPRPRRRPIAAAAADALREDACASRRRWVATVAAVGHRDGSASPPAPPAPPTLKH